MPENHQVMHDFTALGLNGYQSKVMAVLLNLSSANTLTLSEASGVPRTNIYRVMKDLTNLGLAEPVPTIGSSVWACAGWEHVLDTIEAHLHEELESRRARLRRLRQAFRETSNTAEETNAPVPAPHLPATNVRAQREQGPRQKLRAGS